MAKSFDELVKRTTTKPTRAKAARRTQELLGQLLLSEIRQVAGKSQQQVADALGIKQPSLSKLEKQSDMQISTLRKIVKALGGELEILARFPKGTVKMISSIHRLGGSGAGPRNCSWCDSMPYGVDAFLHSCAHDVSVSRQYPDGRFPRLSRAAQAVRDGSSRRRLESLASTARCCGVHCRLAGRANLGPRADSRSLGRADLR